MRSARWTATRKTATLAVQAERDFDLDWANGDPEPDYRFAYALPSDFLYPRFISGYSPFVMGTWDDIHRSLATNIEDAVFVYSRKDVSPALWDQGLADSIIYGLAAAIAMPLTAKPQRARDMLEIANSKILEARAQTLNEDDNIQWDSIPDWLAIRGVSGTYNPSRYIYANGPLLSLPSVISSVAS